MERTPECYFVVAIVESKEGDNAVVVHCKKDIEEVEGQER